MHINDSQGMSRFLTAFKVNAVNAVNAGQPRSRWLSRQSNADNLQLGRYLDIGNHLFVKIIMVSIGFDAV